MKPSPLFLSTSNDCAVQLDAVPTHPPETLRDALADALGSPSVRVLAFFALPDPEGHRLIAALGNADVHTILLASTLVTARYTAFTPSIPALHMFEREIAEQTGIIPEGHPWLKPVRFHRSEASSPDAGAHTDATPIIPGDTTYFTVAGDGEHEVAVGPVHAGVIEPGHFRFQCLGEDVHHLEISLGYQHRGIEKQLEGGPNPLSLHFAETAAGDTTIASTWNYAAVIEALSGITPSADTILMRRVLLELERLANHVGDLGALAGDVAFLPTHAYCGRLRGEYLNMTAELAGNRFGRNLIVPGGMRQTFTAKQAQKILPWMRKIKRETDNALALFFDEPSVLDRLENTGPVDTETAREIGLVGVAGRASGLILDARTDFPHTGETDPIPPTFMTLGDVFSRAKIRRDEIEASHIWLFSALEAIAKRGLSDIDPPIVKQLAPASLAISITEAWRGELVHIAITNERGNFKRYKIIDPSFHNWFGLALSLRGEQISHFPICNKSFSLSYCGHDL